MEDQRDVVVSKHAKKRIRERLGVNKKGTGKVAEKALQFGITHSEAKGKLHRYLDSIYFMKDKPICMRVYNHSVYLFKSTTLITVLPLPRSLWVRADKLQKQKMETIKEQEEYV